MDWYIDTSGVPDAKRDSREMPTYDPTTPFPDEKARAAAILDGDS